MADIINLRSAKKAAIRAKARAQGDENAAKFGQSRAEKTAEKLRADKAKAQLDAHKRETP
jgi:hypothetical protein